MWWSRYSVKFEYFITPLPTTGYCSIYLRSNFYVDMSIQIINEICHGFVIREADFRGLLNETVFIVDVSLPGEKQQKSNEASVRHTF